jgi:hypothetical protein
MGGFRRIEANAFFVTPPLLSVIARLDRAIQYSVSLALGTSKNDTDYWMPRLKRGMTASV